MYEFETLRGIQFTQNQLYKQLNQAMSAARGCLQTYKRETQRRVTR
jgi:hypothetical protein